jgi:hypothetical protein
MNESHRLLGDFYTQDKISPLAGFGKIHSGARTIFLQPCASLIMVNDQDMFKVNISHGA